MNSVPHPVFCLCSAPCPALCTASCAAPEVGRGWAPAPVRPLRGPALVPPSTQTATRAGGPFGLPVQQAERSFPRIFGIGGLEFTRVSGTEVAGVCMERQRTELTAFSLGCCSSAGRGEARPGSGLLWRFFYSCPPIDVLTGGPEGSAPDRSHMRMSRATRLRLIRRPSARSSACTRR